MRKHGFDSRQGRMKVDYLNLSRAEDLKSPKERILYRFFEILPGALSLGALGAAFFLSWLAPKAAAIFIIAFDLYWLLRIFYLSLHQIASFLQMRKNLKTDWRAKLEKSEIENWRDIYHLIILPMCREKIEIVRPTLESLAAADYPKAQMLVVLTVEERAGDSAQRVAEEVEREFSQKFFKFLATTHPRNIPGEAAGKGSNQAWAIKEAKEKIINLLKIPSENIIVSGFDIDTRIEPQYLACLTWHYLTAERPRRTSYQPIPVYNNNIWEAPAFSRVIATSSTFWQMMQQERQEQLVTYSSHSMPFEALEEVGYPSNLVSDDSRIFWKSYLYYDGDYRVVPLYYPVYMDTVMAKTLVRTIINQYRQQRRWAWGVENVPYLLFNFLKNPEGVVSRPCGAGKKIPLREKFRHAFNILDGFWSWATCALIIFFLGWLPIVLGRGNFNLTILSFYLPKVTSYILSVANIGIIACAVLNFWFLPPRPPYFGKWRYVFFTLQWLLTPINLILFGSAPALEAQTRLLLKKYLGFWVTPKHRKLGMPQIS